MNFWLQIPVTGGAGKTVHLFLLPVELDSQYQIVVQVPEFLLLRHELLHPGN